MLCPIGVSGRIYTGVYDAIQNSRNRDCGFGKGWDFAMVLVSVLGSGRPETLIPYIPECLCAT